MKGWSLRQIDWGSETEEVWDLRQTERWGSEKDRITGDLRQTDRKTGRYLKQIQWRIRDRQQTGSGI